MSPSDENALARRAQHGGRDALAALWDALTPKLFGYLVNTVRNRALAEDILQTTRLKAIAALPRLRGRDMQDSRLAFRDSAERMLVEHILSRLSEDDREIPRLRYVADLPANDIARILSGRHSSSLIGARWLPFNRE